MASGEARFAILTEDELGDILDNKDAKQTKRVVEYAVCILEKYMYCECRGTTLNKLEKLEDGELNEFFRRFYAEVHTKSGDLLNYAKNTAAGSLIFMRYSKQI